MKFFLKFFATKDLRVFVHTSIKGTSLPSLINHKDGGKPAHSEYPLYPKHYIYDVFISFSPHIN